MYDPRCSSPLSAIARSIARLFIARSRLTMVKQPDCWTKILMIASGLPRFNSRHHSLSGGTMPSVPMRCVQTGISCSPLAWSLWPELASAHAEVETSAAAAPAISAYLVIVKCPLSDEAPHLTGIYPSRKAVAAKFHAAGERQAALLARAKSVKNERMHK